MKQDRSWRPRAVALALLVSSGIMGSVSAQGRFRDVPPDHWAYDAVNELAERGILLGYPETPRAAQPAARFQATPSSRTRSRSRPAPAARPQPARPAARSRPARQRPARP